MIRLEPDLRGRVDLGQFPHKFIKFADFWFGQWLCKEQNAFSVTDD